MSFKTDWSFLEKITMGAAGTQKVIELLNNGGHNVIELERYCTSNKIWSTKIKRLRMPDLLCLKCGKRIESRAKSKLGVIMSDTETNPDRRWFVGLRDEDVVAFITCYKDAYNHWSAGDTVNLFSVKDMLASESGTQLSAPKSVFEGSERDRTWKSHVPGFDFTVTDIEENDEFYTLKFQKSNGNRASKKVAKDQYIYVRKNEQYKAKEKIVAGIVPMSNSCCCSDVQYDFYTDFDSNIQETKYAAVKALGYLQKTDRAIRALYDLVRKDDIDNRVRLEAYASLLRLGEDAWDGMTNFMNSLEQIDLKMEYILILGELSDLYPKEVALYLGKIISFDDQEEMVAAAIWSLPNNYESLSMIVEQCFSEVATIRNHAIAKIEKHFVPEMTSNILDHFGEDTGKNAICTHILTHTLSVNRTLVVERYTTEINEDIKKWILFVIGLSDRNEYRGLIEDNDEEYENTFSRLEVLWECYPHLMDQVQVDDIEFIKQQK